MDIHDTEWVINIQLLLPPCRSYNAGLCMGVWKLTFDIYNTEWDKHNLAFWLLDLTLDIAEQLVED